MLMEATHSDQVAEESQLQLRILSGVHEGACIPVVSNAVLQVSNNMDADVWISDAQWGGGSTSWLYTDGVRWALLPQPPEGDATSAAVSAHWLEEGSNLIGDPLWVGAVCLTVSYAHQAWQDVQPVSAGAQELVSQDDLHMPQEESDLTRDMEGFVDARELVTAQPAELSQDACSEKTFKSDVQPVKRTLYIATAFLLAGAGWLIWLLWPISSSPGEMESANVAVSEQAQHRYVQEARLVVAMADPALRLQIEPLSQGGVRVAGWVADQLKLDHVVQALSSLRPLPRIALRTVTELNDVMAEVGQSYGVRLSLTPSDAGGVIAQGVLWQEEQRSALLADLKERLPPGLVLTDGIRTPEEEAPQIAAWLKGQGFEVQAVQWKAAQMHITIHLRRGQRSALEQLLLRKGHPLEKVPYLISVAERAQANSRRLAANAPGTPVQIRTVVGGANPYLITMTGDKLQLGSKVGSWKLVEIGIDHVRWDGPYSLEVGR